MKRTIITLFFILNIFYCWSQQFIWDVDLYTFFDNTEFNNSSVKDDQTMAGARIAPSIGFEFDTVHTIMAGFSVLQEFGSRDLSSQFIAYYALKSQHYDLYMGAFPRKVALDDYPRVFFQDSIKFYRPIMNGLSFTYKKDSSYINTWLDWTSRQSSTQREIFFAGLAGRLQKGAFYLQHYSYLMHYAKMLHAPPNQYIYDNSLMLTSLGIDLSDKIKLDKIDLNIGWLCGLEDNRGTTDWLMHNGGLIDLTLEYAKCGIKNTYYIGNKQMYFYSTEGNNLYWGEPFYRLNAYNRTDLYVNFMITKHVHTQLTYSLHASEKKVFHEQMLRVVVNLNNTK